MFAQRVFGEVLVLEQLTWPADVNAIPKCMDRNRRRISRQP
jgi:hypothetical protein